jgi:hypothetical protein
MRGVDGQNHAPDLVALTVPPTAPRSCQETPFVRGQQIAPVPPSMGQGIVSGIHLYHGARIMIEHLHAPQSHCLVTDSARFVNLTPPDTPVTLHRYNYNLSFCYPRRMADSNRNGMLFSSGDSPNSSTILFGGTASMKNKESRCNSSGSLTLCFHSK